MQAGYVCGGANSSLVELRLLHQLLRRKWDVRVCHISNDQNDIADHLAKHAAIGNPTLQLFEALPDLIKDVLTTDCNGSNSV
ncbi:hypothetical protein J1N35_021423 [Gossypium stocksii]|uniref:RNase H type-1 domain-containing protein n=1 Tax=Gossypium stocksii TaxID=47602 RepID=A0A9D3VFP6_9ROSI|nr:hypothetical protein J1N35_021423 [Gossypium stocksii]